MLTRFPYPMQKLIVEEYRKVDNEDAAKPIKLRPLSDDPSYRCLFYRQWQLPCRHIILQEKVFRGVLTNFYWDNWCQKWEESGFELYEGITTDYVNGPVDQEISAPRRILVDAGAIFEELKSHLYMFHDNTKHWPEEAREETWASWLNDLDKVTGPLHREGVEQFKARLPASSQAKLEASLQETQEQMEKVARLGVDFEYYEDEDDKDSDEAMDSEEWEG
jgi:hypothetical protein